MTNGDNKDDLDEIKERYLATANELMAEGHDPQFVTIGAYLAGRDASRDHSFETHQVFSMKVAELAADYWEFLEEKLIATLEHTQSRH